MSHSFQEILKEEEAIKAEEIAQAEEAKEIEIAQADQERERNERQEMEKEDNAVRMILNAAKSAVLNEEEANYASDVSDDDTSVLDVKEAKEDHKLLLLENFKSALQDGFEALKVYIVR